MIEITDKTKCCGCGACKNVCPKQCIKMFADEKGFLYPTVDESVCVNCGLCNKICPITHGKENDLQKTAYAAYNTDEAVRFASSSGGMFGLLAKKIIEKGGVVFGAAFESDYKSVYHIGVDNLEELPKLYGSKYLQSDTGNSYKEVEKRLQEDRFVLFVGTSCQVVGLKSYLKKDYEKLITVDVICHGVPSPKVWSDYAAIREGEVGAKLNGVAFRDKRCGWSNSVLLLLLFDNGKEAFRLSSKDYYIKGFLSNLYLRDSCYACRFKGKNVLSDISLGDFWGIEKVLPNFSDNKGASAVIINTDKGAEIFDEIKSETVLQSVSYNSVLAGNPALEKSCAKPEKSDKFWSLYQEKGLQYALKKCCKTSLIKRLYLFCRHKCAVVLRKVKNLTCRR